MSGPRDLPAYFDETIYQGDAFNPAYRIWYEDENGEPALLDTTGWTGRMGIKAKKNDTEYVLHSDDGDITVTTGIQGTGENAYCLEVYISAANTASLPAGMIGVYDIELTDPAGLPRTYLAGAMCVEGDVT